MFLPSWTRLGKAETKSESDLGKSPNHMCRAEPSYAGGFLLVIVYVGAYSLAAITSACVISRVHFSFNSLCSLTVSL